MWYMYVIHGLSLGNFSSETARLVLPCQHYFTPEFSLRKTLGHSCRVDTVP
ncbi:hypothetical protein GGP50_002838 [Salinibacter ruber]|nr:hypothetical protein [Salinibacter ruber]MCS4188245.1 hypothetical protein [Salinibacter ruber]MCS4194608.1 hypothetical protein [Salinibacter ruber]